MPFLPGQVINNRYRIVKALSQGGFGMIFRTWDTSLKRPVAVKQNLDSSIEGQEQFEREAHFLAGLHHPNLARVTDYFSLPDEGQFLVMDFVEGEDLQTMISRTGPLPEEQAVAWVSQVCDALVYIHNQNPPIIHRDVKPANIRINPEGRAMLVDFGIAKKFDPTKKTVAGARAVTPGYSPIEQYGQGTTEPRTDLYALGATLYTLLTGKEPPESVQRMMGIPLQPVRDINSQVSIVVETATLRAMEIQPEMRFPTALDFQNALKTPLPEAPVMVGPIPLPAVSSKKGVPWLVIILGLLMVISVVAVISGLLEASLLNKINHGEVIAKSEILANDARQRVISLVEIVFLLLTGGFFLAWIYWADKKLRNIELPVKHSPAWAVGGCFVPLLNLVHPYLVVSDLWRMSDPQANIKQVGQRPTTSPVVALWWLLCLATGAISLVAAYMVRNPFKLTRVSMASPFVIAAYALLAVTTGITIWVVSGLDHRIRSKG